MWRFGSSRAWRSVAVGCGIVLICLPSELIAGAVNSPGAVEETSRSKEPFGISTAKVTAGALLGKWLNVETEIDAERQVLKLCEENRSSCQSRTALEFLAIVDDARTLEGRARIGEINRAINQRIRPMSDLALYGVDDVWSPPLATLDKGAGDCEDYAIAKFVALQEAGIPAEDLRIVVLRDDIRKEDHAVVAARLNGNWLMLDNLHLVMAENRQIRDFYRPIFLIDHDGVKRYIGASSTSVGAHGYEQAVGQIPH
jgi:predicted transglutaminase-like cysteine proteinase